jgi:hypothetical protein
VGRRGPYKPVLTVAQVLAWAHAHRRQTGGWPTVKSGRVPGGSGDSWEGIDSALRLGTRGLPGADSLSQLLRRELGLPERRGGARARGRPREEQ